MSETSIVTEFRWIEAGNGLPVLCLHGLFGASDHWERPSRPSPLAAGRWR